MKALHEWPCTPMNGDRAAGEGEELGQRENPKPMMLIVPCVLPQPRHPTVSPFGTVSLPPTQRNLARDSPLWGSPPF